jgi:hypothetical protein
MKRFLLITIEWYYPNGGINDVSDSVDTEEEAVKWFEDIVARRQGDECWSVSYQVFDCERREITRMFSSNH